jgi:transcriptional regulator with XRE-family HTH domain
MSNDKKKKLEDKKKLICKTMGKKVKSLRGDKGILLFSYEYDLSSGSLHKIEKGTRDPQLTTLWRISEAFGVPFWQLIKEIQEDLPENFSFYDK